MKLLDLFHQKKNNYENASWSKKSSEIFNIKRQQMFILYEQKTNEILNRIFCIHMNNRSLAEKKN